MIKQIGLLIMMMCAVTFAGFFEKSLTDGAGTEVSLSTLTTSAQAGTNTYLLLNSTNASDTQNITVKYMTSGYALKSYTVALTGTTQKNTSVAGALSYNITNQSVATAVKFDVSNWTITSNGKNASLTCANYTNVYHVEGTSVSYKTNMTATGATDTSTTVVGDYAVFTAASINNITTDGNTYFSTIWYYYNPPLTITVFENSTNNYLPIGNVFASTASFTVTGANTNLNNSWKNDSNHSQGYVNTAITVVPNADLVSFNVTTNRTTQPVLSQGFVIIASAKLVQNKRVIVSDLEASKCVNASLMKLGSATNAINSTKYTTSGSVIATLTDAAYVYGVTLASAASGSVTVKDVAGNTLYTVPIAGTAPTDNGGSMMCISSSGCTVTNMIYGGDALWKMSAKIWGKTGTNTTKIAVYQAAGSSNFGAGLIKFGAGERLVFYGTPAANNTNMSMFYEAG